MSYTRLREEGLRLLEQMNGGRWTDFNAHDPGITLLESLCYVLSDLAYRAGFDVSDLLASGGGKPRAGLFPPEKILTCRPVTPQDLRKVILDVEGVRNAWVEAIGEESVAFFYRLDRHQVLAERRPPVTVPISPRGCYRILVEPMGLPGPCSDEVYRRVVGRLQENRGLCEDFAEVRMLDIEKIRVEARVEISSVEDPEGLLLDLFQRLADTISPPVELVSVESERRAGTPVEAIFDGPLLEHGVLPAALPQAERRSMLHASDLLHGMMDVAAVEAVPRLRMASRGAFQAWRLPLDPGKAPKLDFRGSEISLEQAGHPVAVDVDRVRDTFCRLQAERNLRTLESGDESFGRPSSAPQPGRDRGVARYASLRHHLPGLYGLGGSGFSEADLPERRAQIRQLEAFVFFFDQILADGFEQLAHVGELFSAESEELRTYFGQLLGDPFPGQSLYVHGREGYRRRHEALVEAADSFERKNRFLDHLLARFAETLTGSAFLAVSSAGPEFRSEEASQGKQARDKLAFLRRIATLGGERGRAFDYLRPVPLGPLAGDGDGDRDRGEPIVEIPPNAPGLTRRLHWKLGLEPARGECLVVVEHILLRPVSGDRIQTVPWLEACRLPDPFSLQLSILLPGDAGRFSDPSFRAFAEQIVREETPAHLTPFLCWLGDDEWASFQQAYGRWLEALRAFKRKTLDLPPEETEETMALIELEFRGARDRLVDQLGLGETYPIQNPSVETRLKVAPGSRGVVNIEPGQVDVTYELRDRNGQALQPPQDAVRGNGGVTLLPTPPIQADTTFTILARKIPPSDRADFLIEPVTIEMGIDTRLEARILIGQDLGFHTELLSSAHAEDGDPRITDYGGQVRVEILGSQEGVDYDLVGVDADGERSISQDGPAGHRSGDLHTLVLRTVPLFEDVTVRVRCQRDDETEAEGRQIQTELLDVHLPLDVRPNLACAFTVAPQEVVTPADDAIVRLSDSQTSVDYQLWGHLLDDPDFLYAPFDAGDGRPFLPVPGHGDEVRILLPERGLPPDAAGFAPVGPPRSGLGDAGPLEWDLHSLPSDLMVWVEARKSYPIPGGQPVVYSHLIDGQAIALLAPDPAPGLCLEVPITPSSMRGPVRLSGGEGGVFYHLRRGRSGGEQDPPAYFFEIQDRPTLDGTWPSLTPAGLWPNKGLGKLRLEGDFVVARAANSQGPDPTPAERPFLRAPDPILTLRPQPVGSELFIRAVQERTLLSQELGSAPIPAPPTLEPQEPVPVGSPATIRVRSSVVEETYQLFIDGAAASEASTGTGGDLDLTTTRPLTADTDIDVHLSRSSPGYTAVTRVLTLHVTVSEADPSLLLHLPLRAIHEREGARWVEDSRGRAYAVVGEAQAVTVHSDPVHGEVLAFNGTNGYIHAGSDHRFDFTGSLTFEFWAKRIPGDTRDWLQFNVLWNRSSTLDGSLCTFVIYHGSANQHYRLNVLKGFTNAFYEAQAFPMPMTWVHVAVVYERSKANQITLFADGKLVSSGQDYCQDSMVPAQTLTIGERLRGVSYKGLLSNLRIYDRALTQEEIRADMNADRMAPGSRASMDET